MPDATRDPGGEAAASPWLAWSAVAFLTAIVVLQETRWAPLAVRQERALWASVVVALVAAVLLRSGWRTDADWEARQRALGTLSNSYYAPRRRALEEGGAVAGGVLAALWWGAIAWIVLVNGIRHHTPAQGLLNLQAAVIVGAATGSLVGAVAGRLAGSIWEARHRRRRLEALGPPIGHR